ncbi:MAG: hypothetical protein HYZ28_25870 [Myxococcales bacterium]|nr:hypothetical protein [Myxococcales bacterium]
MRRFLFQPNRRYRDFQLVFTLLTANFFFPALSYVLTPEIAAEQMGRINELLGGVAIEFPEAGNRFWRYLGAANVMTLALMCLLLQLNLRRFYVVLWPLTFLKAYNATLFLFGFLAAPGFRALLAVAIFDYLTSAAFVFFARRAHREIRGASEESLVPRPLGAAS